LQVCATLTRTSPPPGSGPQVIGSSSDVTSITITPREMAPTAVCDSPVTYTLPPTSCKIPTTSTNSLLINNSSFDFNLVDRDSITFTQTFPDSSGAAYVTPGNAGADHYNLGTTTVSVAATDSLGENSTCTTSITVKVWPGLVLGMKIKCFRDK
jgi:hypothetical protein